MAYDSDEGFYHLTPRGWVRKDVEPFPEGRVETWRYTMHQSSGWSEERRKLHCRWVEPNVSRDERDSLRKQFGWPYGPRSKHSVIGDPPVKSN
jgi:hypothetical protein